MLVIESGTALQYIRNIINVSQLPMIQLTIHAIAIIANMLINIMLL